MHSGNMLGLWWLVHRMMPADCWVEGFGERGELRWTMLRLCRYRKERKSESCRLFPKTFSQPICFMVCLATKWKGGLTHSPTEGVIDGFCDLTQQLVVKEVTLQHDAAICSWALWSKQLHLGHTCNVVVWLSGRWNQCRTCWFLCLLANAHSWWLLVCCWWYRGWSYDFQKGVEINSINLMGMITLA